MHLYILQKVSKRILDKLLILVKCNICKKVVRFILSAFCIFSISIIRDSSFADPFCIIEFALVLYIFFKSNYKILKHTRISALAFSFLLSMLLILGKKCASGSFLGQYEGNIPQTLHLPVIILMILAISQLIYHLFIRLFYIYQRNDFSSNNLRTNGKKVFLLTFIVIIISWLPFFLRYWPGALTSDSMSQVYQASGIISPSDHHPYAHTLIIKLLYSLGNSVFGSSNAGVAVYSIFQMFIMGFIFAYLIFLLYKSKLATPYIVCFVLFFAIIPINVIYSFTMWKNIFFSGAVLLLSISIWQLIIRQKEHLPLKTMYLLFVFSSISVSVLQSNGIFITIACIPFILFVMKKRILIATAICLIPVILYILIKGPLWNMLKVGRGDLVESLSIPLQQISRVVVDNDTLSQEDSLIIETIIPLEKIKEKYLKYKSDPIKVLVREYNGNETLASNASFYLQFWIRLGFKHPKSYINAFLDQTYGYWYTDVDYWVIDTGIIPNELGIQQTPLIYNKVASAIDFYIQSKRFPVWGLLWSSGAYVISMLMMAILCIMRKRYFLLIVFIPCLTVWLTLLIATPVYAEFRYIYSIMIALPLFISVSLLRDENEKLTSITKSYDK